MFVIPDECKPYMEMQVVQYKDDPLAPWKMAIREAALYCEWLPRPGKLFTVLDFGSGLGRTTVMLRNLYRLPPWALFYLVDKSEISPKLTGGWRPDHDEWCNDLECTQRFVEANGLISYCLFRDVDDLGVMPSMDLIISTLAVGFHWPIEDYLFDPFARLCREGTVLIFGVRHGKYSAQTEFAGFETLGYAESGSKQDFLALRKV